MKLSKALKHKNKLVKEIQDLKYKISSHIVVEEGNERPYDVHALAAELNSKKKELVQLKVNIQTKNVNLLEKLYTLSELKDTLVWMKGIPTGTNLVSEYRNGEYIKVKKISAFSVKETDELVTAIQTQIEKLQDEIDEYNATTDIG
jgi:peptidoglycan hydrolase CwlO-like protein